MICVHFLKLKCLAADSAFMSLLFIRCESVPSVKGTDRQLLFLASQQIFIDAGFFGYVLVTHQALDLRFEVFLANGRPLQVVASQRTRSVAGFGETPLGIGGPAPGIDGVAQLLVGQLLTRDIDDTDPVQLLAVCTVADVYE